jgi:hypothetical protein
LIVVIDYRRIWTPNSIIACYPLRIVFCIYFGFYTGKYLLLLSKITSGYVVMLHTPLIPSSLCVCVRIISSAGVWIPLPLITFAFDRCRVGCIDSKELVDAVFLSLSRCSTLRLLIRPSWFTLG